MSGPKTAVWSFDYDPTPTRLADLERFAAKQDAWLRRHEDSIQFYLGDEILASARQARQLVDECISAEDPDSGFDAYGAAWSLFNQLHRRTKEAKRQEADRKDRDRPKEQQTVAKLVSDCQALWEDPDNHDLLLRWAEQRDIEGLASSLAAARAGEIHMVHDRITAWRRRFDQILSGARQASSKNSDAIQGHLPRLHAVIEDIGRLHIGIIDSSASFVREKDQLHQQADEAVQDEDLSGLEESIRRLEAFRDNYTEQIALAEFEKATANVRDALGACGYTVTSRTDENGVVVLRASGFPCRSVDVELRPGSEEMCLNVDSEVCVKDVRSLQAELARQGMQLSVVDWGRGDSHGLCSDLQRNTVVGGES